MPPKRGRWVSAAARRDVGAAGAWNLALNISGKAETLALIIGGAMIGGLGGVGVASTAFAAVYLGTALADFGLIQETGRLTLVEPTRASLRSARRAAAFQIPFAGVLAPAAFYFVLGNHAGSDPVLLAMIGALALTLMGTMLLTAVFNSALANFRTPALWLTGARAAASVLGVAGAAVLNSPAAILGAFEATELISLVGLAVVLARSQAALAPGLAERSRVRRAHLWLGATAVSNVLTNQSDTLLVAAILSPRDLGLFSIASLLQNGVGTTSLAALTPTALNVVRAVAGRLPAGPALRRAAWLGVRISAVVAALAWGGAQLSGALISRVAPLDHAHGRIVLAVSLLSTLMTGPAGVLLAVGIGCGQHRRVGIAGIVTGCAAVFAICVGAAALGVIGAAAGTVVRDAVLLVMSARAVRPPRARASQSPNPGPEAPLQVEAGATPLHPDAGAPR